jgi:hypothetical protein
METPSFENIAFLTIVDDGRSPKTQQSQEVKCYSGKEGGHSVKDKGKAVPVLN